jgi:hypothetical protein
MNRAANVVAAFVLAAFAFFSVSARADPAEVTPKGQWLAEQLDSMGVENKWIAGAHIDWETGLPDGRAEVMPGRHTHCSAFVASAAKKLGVYILRPPEHRQVLLANAQNEWLSTDGRSRGWRRVSDPVEAQSLANRGLLVVASYHNHNDDKPGHISIIRPAKRSLAEIDADGPLSIQAGTANSSSIPVRQGFAGHTRAWRNDEIEYFAHEIAAP